MMSEVCHDPLIATVMGVTSVIWTVMEVTRGSTGRLLVFLTVSVNRDRSGGEGESLHRFGTG
jgi:hypothetical protein